MILSLIGDKSLIYRCAIAESKRIGELLKLESLEKLYYIAKNTFGWNVELLKENNLEYDVKIHFTNYISNIPQFSKEWKLVNRHLEKGYVYIRKSELARLLEEAVKKFIISKCSEKPYLRDVPDSVAEFLEKIVKLWSHYRSDFNKVKIITERYRDEVYPPCIKKLLDDLKSGKNLPHAARFALATYLLNIGKSVDEIVDLFRASPDFNEKIARYQVEHLAGLRGSRIKYVPYKCANTKSLGLCVDIDGKICRNISHPLQFYLRAIRKKIQEV